MKGCPEPYFDIYFNITIRRKTLFYTVYIYFYKLKSLNTVYQINKFKFKGKFTDTMRKH